MEDFGCGFTTAHEYIITYMREVIGKLLFWQPKRDYLRLIKEKESGTALLVLLNYLIWPFLALISFLLVYARVEVFSGMVAAIVIGEVLERLSKKYLFWKRPLYQRKDDVPPGLVKKWYDTGSFPSGHTVKATYFFLMSWYFGIMNPVAFGVIALPILLFRVLVGFHYPVDMLGGVVIGTLIFGATFWISQPELISTILVSVFNWVFWI